MIAEVEPKVSLFYLPQTLFDLNKGTYGLVYFFLNLFFLHTHTDPLSLDMLPRFYINCAEFFCKYIRNYFFCLKIHVNIG